MMSSYAYLPKFVSYYRENSNVAIDIKMGKTCNFLAMPIRWRSQCLEIGNFSDLPSIDGRYLPMAKGFQQSVSASAAEVRGQLKRPNEKFVNST